MTNTCHSIFHLVGANQTQIAEQAARTSVTTSNATALHPGQMISSILVGFRIVQGRSSILVGYRIVQGRRNNTPRHARLCLVHSAFDARHTQVEDIRHFLLECPAY